ncbi:MAG: 4'-phosphopantetheinyl transferase superfamily protein [Cyanobacteriota bacterium]|nr:4'-phosphopantetheinyl transferase superfamily protein [Cyanobacteriota bacterium]
MTSTELPWRSSPLELDLSPDRVQIWHADLNHLWRPIDRWYELLSPDERQRADRFLRPVDCHSFVTARGVLRELLGRYLNLEPKQIEFGYTERGKPFILNGDRPLSLEFNLSHSGGVALYAIACHRRVGIDVESHRDLEVLSLARRFFSEREYDRLCEIPPERQTEAFYSIWTAKEALLKATGEGLIGLSRTEIALTDSEFAPMSIALSSVPPAWHLQPLKLGPGYSGAVAIEGKKCHLDYYALSFASSVTQETR